MERLRRKGNKGQRSRSGGNIKPWFEGGQMPIQRRLPVRGFTNLSHKEYTIINIRCVGTIPR